MSRSLRGLLLGILAIGFLYLVVHAHEPLRLNVGDPWSDANVLTSMRYVQSEGFLATSFADVLDVGPLTADSYRYIHYPPFAEIFYGAVGKYFGIRDIGTLRFFALAWSALAMGLLFEYARRLYSDRIALIATTLFATSPLWMMYADSIHQAPVMWATAFLALWGLVRGLESKQRRHYAAAGVGCFLCFFTSYDCYIYLPAAVIVTVYAKAGNPFARGKRHFVAICAGGCALGILVKCLTVIGAVGWNEFVADLRVQFFERASSTYDRGFELAVVPTLVRRFTLAFTPLVWITTGVHVIKAVRAPTWIAALRDTATWMLVAALAFIFVFSELAASQMLPSQVVLPFYAIGSAVVIDRLLDGRKIVRGAAVAWLVAAPVWTFSILLAHPRSFLERGDVAKTTAYLAANDRNDFVMTNVVSAGHIQAAFERHAWGAPDAADTTGSANDMMQIFETIGTDVIHEIIFTDRDSRFIDKSLWPLAMPRHLWSVTGWPYLVRGKSNAVIAEYDRRVLDNLAAVHAKLMLQLGNYAVYRVDRATVAELLASQVPTTNHIDFGSLSAKRHLLMGFGDPHLLPPEQAPVTTITGFERCQEAKCKTVLTKFGLETKHTSRIPGGQLMLRVDRVCDLRLTFRFATTSYVRFRVGDFVTTMNAGTVATFTIPASSLKQGINVVELESLLPASVRTHLETLDIASCTTP